MQAVQVGGVPAPKARLYSMSRTLARPKGASFLPVRVKHPSVSVVFIHNTGWSLHAIHLWAYHIFGSGPQCTFFRENRSNLRPWVRGVKASWIFRVLLGL